MLEESSIENERSATPKELALTLLVTDPDVIRELMRRADGTERLSYALHALKIGISSLQFAIGTIDSTAINEAGNKLISEMQKALVARGAEINNQVTTALMQYFDPNTGLLTQRIQSLVRKDGDLERILSAHLGADDSMLARSLTRHLGTDSPFFMMLSPTDANGLRAQMSGTIEQALSQQRECILREFSLDYKDSALSRLVLELTDKHNSLGQGIQVKMDEVIREFSLDHPNSALSRLVDRVESAQRSINEQFSVDNGNSALNRLSKLLQNTTDEINRNLTLDDDQSSLSRLKKELQGTLDDMVRSNVEFHSDVRSTLSALQARKAEAERSTRHGNTFEEQLGELLAVEAQKLGDLHHQTGNTTGAIKNSKKGDHLITLGAESPAPGARIIWEAKEDKSYSIKDALEEIEEARKNRQSQIGVFVFSQKTAPVTLQPFSRYGQDVLIIWDAEDSSSNIVVKAAYSVSRALSLRQSAESKETLEAMQQIELSARHIEKQMQYMDDFKRWGETIKGHGEKIADRSDRVKRELLNEVERLDEQLRALKSAKLLDPGDFAF